LPMELTKTEGRNRGERNIVPSSDKKGAKKNDGGNEDSYFRYTTPLGCLSPENCTRSQAAINSNSLDFFPNWR